MHSPNKADGNIEKTICDEIFGHIYKSPKSREFIATTKNTVQRVLPLFALALEALSE